jgi:hypothetical protein
MDVLRAKGLQKERIEALLKTKGPVTVRLSRIVSAKW